MKTLLLSVSLFIGTFAGLQAKTTKFPEKDPAFSVTFPDDWTVAVDSEANLKCKAADGSGVWFIIQKLDAKTEEETKVFLQQIVKTVDLGDAKTAKVSEIKETTTAKGVKLFAITSTNTTSGVEMVYSDTAFAPKKGIYFGLLNIDTAADAKAHEKQITEILNSITPISGDGAE
jgi:hypothetical protein